MRIIICGVYSRYGGHKYTHKPAVLEWVVRVTRQDRVITLVALSKLLAKRTLFRGQHFMSAGRPPQTIPASAFTLVSTSSAHSSAASEENCIHVTIPSFISAVHRATWSPPTIQTY